MQPKNGHLFLVCKNLHMKLSFPVLRPFGGLQSPIAIFLQNFDDTWGCAVPWQSRIRFTRKIEDQSYRSRPKAKAEHKTSLR